MSHSSADSIEELIVQKSDYGIDEISEEIQNEASHNDIEPEQNSIGVEDINGSTSSTVSIIIERLQNVSQTIPDLTQLENKKQRLAMSRTIAESLLEKKREVARLQETVKLEAEKINKIIDETSCIVTNDISKIKTRNQPSTNEIVPSPVKIFSRSPLPIESNDDNISERIDIDAENVSENSIPTEIDEYVDEDSLHSIAESLRIEEDEVMNSIDVLKKNEQPVVNVTENNVYNFEKEITDLIDEISSYHAGTSKSTNLYLTSMAPVMDSVEEKYDETSFEELSMIDNKPDVSAKIDLEPDLILGEADEISGSSFSFS